MTSGERIFVAGCALVTFAVVGVVNLVAGAIMAAFVALLMWSMLLALPDEGRDNR